MANTSIAVELEVNVMRALILQISKELRASLLEDLEGYLATITPSAYDRAALWALRSGSAYKASCSLTFTSSGLVENIVLEERMARSHNVGSHFDTPQAILRAAAEWADSKPWICSYIEETGAIYRELSANGHVKSCDLGAGLVDIAISRSDYSQSVIEGILGHRQRVD